MNDELAGYIFAGLAGVACAIIFAFVIHGLVILYAL